MCIIVPGAKNNFFKAILISARDEIHWELILPDFFILQDNNLIKLLIIKNINNQ
jgi:hypothetical protein